MAVRIGVAFLAGLASVITPCVLPLVPGYLSAVSAVEANRLGERGVARRVAVGSLPFIAGFTGLFGGARRSGSRALLGAAFATCAAPCIGPVLAGILVLAGDTSTVLKGAA